MVRPYQRHTSARHAPTARICTFANMTTYPQKMKKTDWWILKQSYRKCSVACPDHTKYISVPMQYRTENHTYTYNAIIEPTSDEETPAKDYPLWDFQNRAYLASRAATSRKAAVTSTPISQRHPPPDHQAQRPAISSTCRTAITARGGRYRAPTLPATRATDQPPRRAIAQRTTGRRAIPAPSQTASRTTAPADAQQHRHRKRSARNP